MKAIVYKKYGSPEVLQLMEIARPVPGAGEALIKVGAVSVNAYDWRHLRADPFLVRIAGVGIVNPKHNILGGDIAGEVVAVGSSVKHFQPGDRVFGGNTFGGFAEYVCVPEKCLELKPANLTYEQASTVPSAALTALQGLRYNGMIKPGQKVLINGASGGVGSYAVQLAKFFEAEVTGVCSTSKMDMVRAMGADKVIDYKQQDVTKCNERFDRILDIAAYRSVLNYKRILVPHGVYVMVGGATARIFQLLLLSMTGQKNMHIMLAKPNQEDLLFIKELLERGNLRPFIDRTYPLSHVPEALRYFENGYVRGKIVITVDHSGKEVIS